MATIAINLGLPDKSEDVYEVSYATARAVQTILGKKDPITVKHTKWEVVRNGLIRERKCGACGYILDYYTARQSNYCMNCGAKMDLEIFEVVQKHEQ